VFTPLNQCEKMGAGTSKLDTIDKYYNSVYECKKNPSSRHCRKADDLNLELIKSSPTKEDIRNSVLEDAKRCTGIEASDNDAMERIQACISSSLNMYGLHLSYSDPNLSAVDSSLAEVYGDLVRNSMSTACKDIRLKKESSAKSCNEGKAEACSSAVIYSLAVPLCNDFENGGGVTEECLGYFGKIHSIEVQQYLAERAEKEEKCYLGQAEECLAAGNSSFVYADQLQTNAGVTDYTVPLRIYEKGCSLNDKECCLRAKQLHMYHLWRKVDNIKAAQFYQKECQADKPTYNKQDCQVFENALLQVSNEL